MTAALTALADAGIPHRVVRHAPVDSLEEAAAARGLTPDALVKTMVVRLGEGDHILVLVPGDRQIAWRRLRATLGVRRASLAGAGAAEAATGYAPGSITPLGATGSLPVVADARIQGRQVSVGGGEPGVAVVLEGDDLIEVTSATVADVTDPLA